jgi:hypothetical protein
VVPEDHKKPDELGGWSSWARLVLQRQEENVKDIKELKDPDSGFSILRCRNHDKAIEDFKRLQYGLAALFVVMSFLSPLIVLFLKKWIGA